MPHETLSGAEQHADTGDGVSFVLCGKLLLLWFYDMIAAGWLWTGMKDNGRKKWRNFIFGLA